MKVEIAHARSGKVLHILEDVSLDSTVESVKEKLSSENKRFEACRTSLRSDAKGRSLKETDTLKDVGFSEKAESVKLFYKDLGPQIGWKTVFLAEYAGPFMIYLMFYMRPALIYGAEAFYQPFHFYAHIACACWSFHYGKRLLETQFVHRFSNGTMPLMNLFKNCSYYWGFTCMVAYFVNHPLYTPASFGDMQVYIGLACFVLCEIGNFSIHILFRNLRPANSKVRQIPQPTKDPFTLLFNLVSCPNYTYEAGAWISFALLSQTLTALVFALLGLAQMSAWALKKHRNYRKEFENYPRRQAIIPFIL